MKYARTEKNIVVQVVGNNPKKLFAPEYADLFRACDNNVQTGWADDGTTFTAPLPTMPAIPQSVTMRQARLALLGAGKLPSVAAAIAALPSPQKEAVQIDWEYAQTVDRNWPFVLLIGQALALDSAALDSLFVTAAAL